jgi:predicted nuclease of predicted toxin-antitoxin system
MTKFFPMLADENIDPEFIKYLRKSGFDVKSIVEEGLAGSSDETVIQYAEREGRVILTHDRDFGHIAFVQKEKFTGVIFLRPGDINTENHIRRFSAFIDMNIDLKPPFFIVIDPRSVRVHPFSL